MPDSAINGHDPVATWEWTRNFLTQAASGSESGAIGSGAKHRWMSLDALRALLVEVANVANVLTTTTAGKVLDARQGKALKDLIDAIVASEGMANGIATLDSSGKVTASQIPALALVDVYTVASEAEMLACGAEQGDMAIRTDENMIYILATAPATTLGNWVELTVLQDLIQSYIDDLAGAERTTETVYGNAVAIAEEAAARADADTAIQTSLDSANIEIAQLREENNGLKHSLDTANALNSETGEETGNGAVSLPANAINGRLGLQIAGKTLGNIAEQNLTEWSGKAYHSIVDNGDEYEVTVTNASGDYLVDNIMTIGDTFFAMVRVKTSMAGLYFGTTINKTYHSGSGNYEIIAIKGTATDTNLGFNSDTTGIYYVDKTFGIRVFNLTQSYSSTALATITAEKMMRTTPYYFDGLKSVAGYGRFRFVNANLLNNEISWGSTWSNDIAIYTNIAPYKTYRFSCVSVDNATSWRWAFRFYKNGVDVSANITPFSSGYFYSSGLGCWLNSANTTSKEITIFPSADIDCDEIAIMLLLGDSTSSLTRTVNAQLNIGSSALDFIPHEHNDVFYKSADDFLSVPSIEDKLVYINGAWKHKHNVERKVLEASDILSYNDGSGAGWGIDYMELSLSGLNVSDVGGSANVGKAYIDVAIEFPYNNRSTISITTLRHYINSSGKVFLAVPTGTYTDLADAKANIFTDYSLSEIYYQLAEPYYTDVEVSGIPTAYANGSVFNDPVVPDAGVYDSGITILNSDYPIESFERISVYANGVFTDLDISTAVITGDGLSFTHPDLSKDDIVTFDYRYAQASPMGEMTAEYYNSAVILKDTVTGALYRKVDTVASGVLATTLEAV